MREFCLIALTGITMFVVGTASHRDALSVDLPAAMALEPHRYPDGSLSPDYKDAAVLALQVALDRAVADYGILKEHDDAAHRGSCVSWRKE